MNTNTDLADAFARALGLSLPSYKRTGRKWSRTIDGLVTGIHVYRLFGSRGFACEVRLEPFVSLESRPAWAIPLGPTPQWLISADIPAFAVALVHHRHTDLETAIAQARQCIEQEIRPTIEAVATREAFLRHTEGYSVSYRIATHVAFGHREEVRRLLALEPPALLAGGLNLRSLDLSVAYEALAASRFIDEPLSGEWLEFASMAVTRYHGRPPRSDRKLYDSVRALLDSATT